MSGSTVFAALLQHAHGASAPKSPVEYVIFILASVLTAYVLVRAVQMTFHPGENEPDHVKRTILDDEFHVEQSQIEKLKS